LNLVILKSGEKRIFIQYSQAFTELSFNEWNNWMVYKGYSKFFGLLSLMDIKG